MELKICSKCKGSKGLNLFSKDASRKCGYSNTCKICKLVQHKNWRSRNREKVRNTNRNWDKNNPESSLKRKARYRAKESAKEKERQYNRLWDLTNPDKRNFLVAKRRAIKLKATPHWLTKDQFAEIADIYKQAQELGVIFFNRKFHVDHIVPLQGKNVSGLHLPWNLQILTAEENIKKNNKF